MLKIETGLQLHTKAGWAIHRQLPVVNASPPYFNLLFLSENVY